MNERVQKCLSDFHITETDLRGICSRDGAEEKLLSLFERVADNCYAYGRDDALETALRLLEQMHRCGADSNGWLNKFSLEFQNSIRGY